MIISHRPLPALDPDWIIVLKKGGIEAQGRHDDLIGRCAYYRERLALPADMIEEQQLLDLKRASEAVARLGPELELHTFYARKLQGRVLFEHVRQGSAKP